MAYLRLANGGRATTPDASPLDVAGDIELVFVGIPTNEWATGSQYQLLNKYVSLGNQRSFRLYVNNVGQLRFQASSNGSSVDLNITFPVVPSGAVGVKVTADLDSGGGNAEVKAFYTESLDPAWQLLDTQTPTAISGFFDSSAPLTVGAESSGNEPFDGRAYRAQILDGIDGDLVFDADFSDPTTWAPDLGSITEKANGATVTLQGDAELVVEPSSEQSGGATALMLGVS